MSDLSLGTEALLAEEGRLEELARDVEERLSGLKDIDLLLALARVKLTLCLALMKRAGSFEELETTIGRRASEAIRIVESLVSQNVSEDQKGIVQASPLFREVKGLFEEFLVSGGGGFLERLQIDDRKRRIMSRIVASAIRKYIGEDDRYPPLDIERYPPMIQRLLLTLFPIFIRLRPQKPPYGIEEGEPEEIYHSRAMRLPLSQAIFYIEKELLPDLERRLREQPGDPLIQEEIRRTREKLDVYRKLRVTPRSTPVLLEKGFHTEGMTGFTADGEMLVSIPVSVSFKSGTNLDRKMEMVRMDVVRRVAGRGVSAEIDAEYRRLRSIESGIRGSSRTPSFKLDPGWGSWVLRQDFPFIARLSDKKGFQELVRLVQSGSLGAAQRRIAALIAEDQGTAESPSPFAIR